MVLVGDDILQLLGHCVELRLPMSIACLDRLPLLLQKELRKLLDAFKYQLVGAGI